MLYKKFIRVAVWTGLILLIPLILQLTIGTGVDGLGWNWKLNDFIIIGILVFSTGLSIEITMRKVANPKHRILTMIGIVTLFLLVWVGMVHNIGETFFKQLIRGASANTA